MSAKRPANAPGNARNDKRAKPAPPRLTIENAMAAPSNRRYPRWPNVRMAAMEWTGEAYQQVCNALRGAHYGGPPNAEIVDLVRTLATAFKHAPTRAPEVPPSAAGVHVLYRGVHYTRAPAVGATVPSNAGCFTAFTTIKSVAEKFATQNVGSVLYELHIEDVAVGTPWLFFQQHGTTNRRVLPSAMEEGEVLLPPGYFKVLERTERVINRFKVRVVRVAYVPDAWFLHRVRLPRGNSIVRTSGGPVEFAHPNFAASVRRRLERRAPAVVPPQRRNLSGGAPKGLKRFATELKAYARGANPSLAGLKALAGRYKGSVHTTPWGASAHVGFGGVWADINWYATPGRNDVIVTVFTNLRSSNGKWDGMRDVVLYPQFEVTPLGDEPHTAPKRAFGRLLHQVFGIPMRRHPVA